MKNLLFNISIAFNCLLFFLLIFEHRLSVPLWLQVAGRMHPLLLHFPLVLIIISAVVTMIPGRRYSGHEKIVNSFIDWFLLLAAFTAVVSSLMGLFLSKEGGYDDGSIVWHKWGGAFLSVFTLLWYGLRNRLHRKRVLSVAAGIIAVAVVLFTGHLGAGITHGSDFLLAPLKSDEKKPMVSMEEAVVFNDLVKPILEAKCITCHNSKKAKGDLIMETEALLQKGGKNGKLWDSTEADLGLLLRRVHLPVQEKKHMPPKNKPQLTEEEIAIITHWIRKGADFTMKVNSLAAGDSLYLLASAILVNPETPAYAFEAASPSLIEKLNTVNRIISSEAKGSPALSVNFFNSSLFKSSQLDELNKISKQIVSLDLAGMPLRTEDIIRISGFENLRTLNLSFTGISGPALLPLKKLKYLSSLSLAGTKIGTADLEQLKTFPSLKKIFLWKTNVSKEDIAALKDKMPDMRFDAGYNGDTVMMKLPIPVLLNEEKIITATVPLRLKHYVQGASVRYTTDGTEPDSLKSLLFKGGEVIDKNSTIKAKAYKPGWHSSEVLEATFFKASFFPDTVMYINQPNEKYKDATGRLLIDHKQGETNFSIGGWAAWREKRMECLLSFNKPEIVQSVTLSTLIDIGSYIMPPMQIEVWGGSSQLTMKLLARTIPQQPSKLSSAYNKGFDCRFAPTEIKYLKIVAIPVSKLPAWHPGKGDKGWVFVDEILVN